LPAAGKAPLLFFRFPALDTLLHLRALVTRKTIGAATVGHILAIGELMETFSR